MWASNGVNRVQGWYAEFLLKIKLGFLLKKTTARLNFKIDLGTLNTHPGVYFLLKIELEFSLRKRTARLKFKIDLRTLHTIPGTFSLTIGIG